MSSNKRTSFADDSGRQACDLDATDYSLDSELDFGTLSQVGNAQSLTENALGQVNDGKGTFVDLNRAVSF